MTISSSWDPLDHFRCCSDHFRPLVSGSAILHLGFRNPNPKYFLFLAPHLTCQMKCGLTKNVARVWDPLKVGPQLATPHPSSGIQQSSFPESFALSTSRDDIICCGRCLRLVAPPILSWPDPQRS